MKIVPIVILGLLATVGASTHSGLAHTGPTTTRVSGVAAHAGTATIERIVPRSNGNVLELQGRDMSLFEVRVPTGASIAVENQGRVVAAELRSGDKLILQRNGSMVDASQRTVTLSGVVGYAPMSHRDVMTVQITPSRTILVDVDPTTHFSDVTSAPTSPVDVVDADTVIVHGVLDTTLDEVVTARAIERSGPKISRSYST